MTPKKKAHDFWPAIERFLKKRMKATKDEPVKLDAILDHLDARGDAAMRIKNTLQRMRKAGAVWCVPGRGWKIE